MLNGVAAHLHGIDSRVVIFRAQRQHWIALSIFTFRSSEIRLLNAIAISHKLVLVYVASILGCWLVELVESTWSHYRCSSYDLHRFDSTIHVPCYSVSLPSLQDSILEFIPIEPVGSTRSHYRCSLYDLHRFNSWVHTCRASRQHSIALSMFSLRSSEIRFRNAILMLFCVIGHWHGIDSRIKICGASWE